MFQSMVSGYQVDLGESVYLLVKNRSKLGMKTKGLYKTELSKVKMSFDCVVICRHGGSLQLVLVAGGKCVTFSAADRVLMMVAGLNRLILRGWDAPQNTPPSKPLAGSAQRVSG